jgi:hypothetical protein
MDYDYIEEGREGYSDPFWAARREHAWILRKRYKLTLDVIAERLGVTRERARQMVIQYEQC